MARYKIGDRVSTTFMSGEAYGTVIRLERGLPVVRFDDGREGRQRPSTCMVITTELIAMLAGRDPADLTPYQAHLLAENRGRMMQED